MKTFKKYITIGFCTLMALAVSSCQDSVLESPDEPNTVLPDSSDGETYFMALRVYNASSIDGSTRSRAEETTPGSGDSFYNQDSYPQNGHKYDLGIAGENAVYSGFSNPAQSPHFILVFADKTENGLLQHLLPLVDWDAEATQVDNNSSASTSGYNSYKTYYTAANKTEIPTDIQNRNLLVVLNASEALQAKLKSSLYSASYKDILQLKIFNPIDPNSQTQDSNNNDYDQISSTDISEYTEYLYFTAPDNTLYFTMSSSMVIPAVETNGENKVTTNEMVTGKDQYGPAIIKRNFTWQPTKELAAQNPIFSFFVERLQSKVTLSFMKNRDTKRYYFGETGKNAYESEDNITYQPVTSLVLKSNVDFTPSDEWKDMKFVKNYYRHDDERYTENFVQPVTEWKINITGWGINAIEDEEYLFKKLTNSTNYYGSSDDNSWNQSTLSPYRNFWAESAHYETTHYPHQYRPALGLNNDFTIAPVKGIIDWATYKSEMDLRYFGYDSFSTQRKTAQYAPENTFKTDLFTSEWFTNTCHYFAYTSLDAAAQDQAHFRVGSHIIVTAQLLIKGFGPDDIYNAEEFNENGLAKAGNQSSASKFFMNDIFWTHDAYLTYVSEYLGYWMQKETSMFQDSDGVIYSAPNDTDPTVRKIATPSDFSIAAANVKGGDGWITIAPLSVEDVSVEGQTVKFTNLYYYNQTSREYSRIKFSDFQILVMKHPEYFSQHFNYGRMYYAIPLQHYDDLSGNALYFAKYASVRNHWYNYTITSFSAPGTPVSVTNQRIIPNNERSYETLGITLSVKPWHNISTEVDISEQRPNLNPDLIDVDLLIKGDDWNYEGLGDFDL